MNVVVNVVSALDLITMGSCDVIVYYTLNKSQFFIPIHTEKEYVKVSKRAHNESMTIHRYLSGYIFTNIRSLLSDVMMP